MACKERGRIIAKLPTQEGTSANGKNWVKKDMVFETEGQYPKKICVTFFGEKEGQLTNLNEGDLVDVSFSVESREYNGKWFSNINAISVDAVAGGNETGLIQNGSNNVVSTPDENDLPF